MKGLLVLLGVLTSFATYAGDCKTVANPASEWANTNGGNLYLPWVDREIKLENVTIEDCIYHATKELDILFLDQSKIKNVKYKFTDDGIKITGKVSKD